MIQENSRTTLVPQGRTVPFVANIAAGDANDLASAFRYPRNHATNANARTRLVTLRTVAGNQASALPRAVTTSSLR